MASPIFQHAIVREPANSLVDGLTSSGLGPPDLDLARAQHQEYITVLKDCGLQITILPALEDYPDSVFVEDVALCTTRGAILTRPGAPSRRGEVGHMRTSLQERFSQVFELEAPATLDAGDVLMMDEEFFVGRSARTNREGIEQLVNILDEWDFSCSEVALSDFLHLKSGAANLGGGLLLLAGELIEHESFRAFRSIQVPPDESYAANALLVNGKVLIASGFPVTKALLAEQFTNIIELDMSEFQKLDGGLSCLSLRF